MTKNALIKAEEKAHRFLRRVSDLLDDPEAMKNLAWGGPKVGAVNQVCSQLLRVLTKLQRS
jgi:hypothetical protein